MRIYGKHSILAAAKNPQRVKKIFYGHKNDFINLELNKYKCLYSTNKEETFLKTNELFIETPLEQMFNEKRIILLDSLQDPGNIGSIIRTAAILNYGVLIRKRECLINETVVKCASGGVDNTKISYINNIKENLEKFKQNSFQIISLSENNEENIKFNFEKFILIIGSEGFGVNKMLLEESDNIYSLKTLKNFSTYNASVAAAIAMYTLI